MKRLVIMLAVLVVIGAAAMYMLENHADMQVKLATAYDTTADGGDDIIPEAVSEVPAVKFSHRRNFYSEDIDVVITCTDENAAIYYTDDGNEPTENSKLYSSPIHLAAQSGEKCTTIKALAVSGGEKTGTCVKSYIVGRNINERFDKDTLVFVLSADEYDLYDYYNGIAVEGYLRDEFIKNEYKGGEIKPTDPANYNIGGRESERPMYVEVFDSTGEQLISQAVGARVVGGYSRANDQKSWRLFARSEYGEGKFRYPFFTENTDPDGNFITRYDRITLRDGANDREFAGVRDELSMTLAFDAGFPDAQAVRPAAVYLNGEYYGYAWLHEAYSDGYLETMYGGNRENYRIVGSKELEVESDDPADERAIADWNHVIALAEKDLTDDLFFSEFCRLVDIDDLMMYYAMQIFIDNKDWPGNNFKVWRYYPSEGEVTESPYLDGKWRFLFFDAEFAWGLYENGYGDDTLREVLTGKHIQGGSHILRGLLCREDMREKFADTMCELEAGAFSPEHILETLDKLLEKSDKEQLYALINGYTSKWANEWTFDYSRKQIRDFGSYRYLSLDKDLKKQFGYGDSKYSVNVSAPSGADVKLGCLTAESGRNVSVRYYSECRAYLTADIYEGYSPGHWEVNGVPVQGSELVLDSTMADTNGNITVKLFLDGGYTEGKVTVSELYTSGDDDRAVITNTTPEAVNIKGWHLSDKLSVTDRYTLPDCEIPAGGSVTVVMKNNKDTTALMKHQTNFSLKTGETLYFSDPGGNIVCSVPVLELDERQYLALNAKGKYIVVGG